MIRPASRGVVGPRSMATELRDAPAMRRPFEDDAGTTRPAWRPCVGTRCPADDIDGAPDLEPDRKTEESAESLDLMLRPPHFEFGRTVSCTRS